MWTLKIGLWLQLNNANYIKTKEIESVLLWLLFKITTCLIWVIFTITNKYMLLVSIIHKLEILKQIIWNGYRIYGSSYKWRQKKKFLVFFCYSPQSETVRWNSPNWPEWSRCSSDQAQCYDSGPSPRTLLCSLWGWPWIKTEKFKKLHVMATFSDVLEWAIIKFKCMATKTTNKSSQNEQKTKTWFKQWKHEIAGGLFLD